MLNGYLKWVIGVMVTQRTFNPSECRFKSCMTHHKEEAGLCPYKRSPQIGAMIVVGNLGDKNGSLA